jgi:uncharacterized protein (TIGR03000 family)
LYGDQVKPIFGYSAPFSVSLFLEVRFMYTLVLAIAATAGGDVQSCCCWRPIYCPPSPIVVYYYPVCNPVISPTSAETAVMKKKREEFVAFVNENFSADKANEIVTYYGSLRTEKERDDYALEVNQSIAAQATPEMVQKEKDFIEYVNNKITDEVLRRKTIEFYKSNTEIKARDDWFKEVKDKYDGGKLDPDMQDGDLVSTNVSRASLMAAPATMIVRLPANAILTIDASPTKSTSDLRTYHTPLLAADDVFFYDFVATLVVNGESIVLKQRVPVRAGKTTELKLLPGVSGVAVGN